MQQLRCTLLVASERGLPWYCNHEIPNHGVVTFMFRIMAAPALLVFLIPNCPSLLWFILTADSSDRRLS